MSALTKFEVGEMYRNRLGVYTVNKILQDMGLHLGMKPEKKAK